MTGVALAFAGIHKSFGPHVALADFTLQVYEGELFGLVGINGAGKTTLLKCMLDFAAPDAGTIRIFGESHRNTTARAGLAFLPEHFLPPYYLTGGDFLRYMLALYGTPYYLAQAEGRRFRRSRALCELGFLTRHIFFFTDFSVRSVG